MRRCGYAAIIGRPNVGKSTLLNRILNCKISITSRKPQTTRHQIIGIKTINKTQFIYIDTPGLNQNIKQKTINHFMNKQTINAINNVNVILFVVELNKWTNLEDWILNKINNFNIPVFLVINKVDQLNNRRRSQYFSDKILQKYHFSNVYLISAKEGHLIKELEKAIESYLPESKYFFYGKNQITNRSKRFMVAEVIREKLMRKLGQEVPYQLAIEIEKYEFILEKQLIKIHATILVERPGQKAIVIGAKGQKLKEIGSDARKDIEKILDKKIFLQLWVKLKTKRYDDNRVLNSLEYNSKYPK